MTTEKPGKFKTPQRVRELFFVAQEDQLLDLSAVDALQRLDGVIVGVGQAFLANFRGAISTISTPLTFAVSSVQQSLLQQLSGVTCPGKLDPA